MYIILFSVARPVANMYYFWSMKEKIARLMEADFLVNIYEDGLDRKAVMAARSRTFRTASGIRLLNSMFDLEE